MKWVEALKKWNAEKGGAWCVPRKGSPEMEAVKKIMAQGKGPAEHEGKLREIGQRLEKATARKRLGKALLARALAKRAKKASIPKELAYVEKPSAKSWKKAVQDNDIEAHPAGMNEELMSDIVNEWMDQVGDSDWPEIEIDVVSGGKKHTYYFDRHESQPNRIFFYDSKASLDWDESVIQDLMRAKPAGKSVTEQPWVYGKYQVESYLKVAVKILSEAVAGLKKPPVLTWKQLSSYGDFHMGIQRMKLDKKYLGGSDFQGHSPKQNYGDVFGALACEWDFNPVNEADEEGAWRATKLEDIKVEFRWDYKGKTSEVKPGATYPWENYVTVSYNFKEKKWVTHALVEHGSADDPTVDDVVEKAMKALNPAKLSQP